MPFPGISVASVYNNW